MLVRFKPEMLRDELLTKTDAPRYTSLVSPASAVKHLCHKLAIWTIWTFTKSSFVGSRAT